MRLADCHMHSKYSMDGAEEISDILKTAAARGLSYAAITDHCDCNAFAAENCLQNITASAADTRRLGAQADGVTMLTGVELGQAMQDKPAAELLLSQTDFDFVLGSVHNVRDTEDFYFLDYYHSDIETLFEKYFDEILETIEWGRFNSLAHLTYPLRYMPLELRERYEDLFYSRSEPVLRSVARAGKALEVNTSGLRQKMQDTLPGLRALKKFREYGGKYVTIGSDAHKCADIGAGIAKGLSVLQSAGFNEYTVYAAGQPLLIGINQ